MHIITLQTTNKQTNKNNFRASPGKRTHYYYITPTPSPPYLFAHIKTSKIWMSMCWDAYPRFSMPLSNHAHDTLNESSLPGRDSQGHRRSLNNQASPDHQQPSAHERNSPSDRSRNTHNRTRFINPFKQFFRKDDPPPTSSDASSIETNYRLLPLLIGCILPVSPTTQPC